MVIETHYFSTANERVETHEVCLNGVSKNLKGVVSYSVEAIHGEHISNRDFKYAFETRSQKTEGYYEGKNDSYNTGNTVVEFVGYMSRKVLEDNKIPFPPKKSQRYKISTNSEMYNRIRDFIYKCISGELGKVNLGYGAASEESIGNHSLFGYNHRPEEKVKKGQYWVPTGKILSRNMLIYKGNLLRKIVMDALKNGTCELQIVGNSNEKTKKYGEETRYWVSINFLASTETLATALLATISMIDDLTIDKIEFPKSKKS